MVSRKKRKLAIVVPGGNASFNALIAAIWVVAHRWGWTEVIGFHGGYYELSKATLPSPVIFLRDVIEKCVHSPLPLLEVARGGASTPQEIANICDNLHNLGVDDLVVIGGDGSTRGAAKIRAHPNCRMTVVVPHKSIDGFGQLNVVGMPTSAELTYEAVNRIFVDAQGSRRVGAIVKVMGRDYMPLAFRVASALGTMALGPEQFKGKKVKIELIIDLILARMLKRCALGTWPGGVIVAEGLVDAIVRKGVSELKTIPVDADGRPAYSKIPLHTILRNRLEARMKHVHGGSFGIRDHSEGYDTRVDTPVLGDAALAKFLAVALVDGLRNNTVDCCMLAQNPDGTLYTEPLTANGTHLDIHPRGIDLASEVYRTSVLFMDPLSLGDLENENTLRGMAAQTKYSPEQFADVFRPVAEFDWYNGAVS